MTVRDRDRDTFGPRLRVERERRGISLKQIAESTKIKESQFVELERNDFSKWPQGLFRRAHLCAYVSALGLPPQPVLAEFLRLFPEECPVDRSPLDRSDRVEVKNTAPAPLAEAAPKPRRFAPSLMDRAWVVFFDLAAVCLMSSILAAITGMNLWPAIALVGAAYSAIGSACFARSIGTYAQQRMNRPAQKTAPRAVQPKLYPIASKRILGSLSESGVNPDREIEVRRASA